MSLVKGIPLVLNRASFVDPYGRGGYNKSIVALFIGQI
jgi:hypothetical protein